MVRGFLRLALCAVLGVLPLLAFGEAQIPALQWEQRSDWMSVRDFGAKGDGMADDTAAIQRAFDKLDESDYGKSLLTRVVYIPAGQYRITRTLTIAKEHGAWIVGHGRDTVLFWDGEAGGRLYLSNGATYTRYEGLTFDGRGKAAIGVEHESMHYYETSLRYQHCAFLNFTEHGVVVGRGKEKVASAEFWFNNCLFRNCGAGASFLNFNDYDNTFDGCQFEDCGIGLNSVNGNFYLRTSHFARSKVVDVRQASPSHASSIRLCTSQGSRRFFETGTGMHLSMKLQDCRVDGWTDPNGAIVLGHRGPTTIFDCVFTNPPNANAPIRLANPKTVQQLLILSNNASLKTAQLLDKGLNARVTEIPAGKRGASLTSPAQRFLKETATAPGKVFDAVRDFGAKHNGSDDTEALQRCIDAARAHGKGAVAYLPGGEYTISRTLQVAGKDYAIAGTGFRTTVKWNGPKNGEMMRITDPQHLSIEHFVLNGPVETTRIHHVAATAPASSIFYDGVYVNGLEQCDTGLWCDNLPKSATVRMGHVIGNIRLTDCGDATIIGAQHYYNLWLEGAQRGKSGIAGFMFHNDALHNYALNVQDNQDVIVADFYSESNKRYLLCEGGARQGDGRVTIGASKISTVEQEAVTIRNYQGRIFIGGGDGWWQSDTNKWLTMVHEGARPVNFIIAGMGWWNAEPQYTFGPGMTYTSVENLLTQNKYPEYAEKSLPNTLTKQTEANVTAALDDFRELGAAYLQAFYQ